MCSVKGRVGEVVELQRWHGGRYCGRRPRRQDAIDGEKRRRRPLRQRAAQKQRRAQQRRRLPRPRALRAHALARHADLPPYRHTPSRTTTRQGPVAQNVT